MVEYIRKPLLPTAVAVACLILFGCASDALSSSNISEPPQSAQVVSVHDTESSVEPSPSQIVSLPIYSKAVDENNILDENPERTLTVYLPAGYEESEKSYPVVYYLHGFGETPGNFIRANNHALNSEFSENENQFILVGVSASNKSGGSFYANSPVTGYFEDYVTQEVVALIDSTYRTIAAAESRGLCGFSMGGFGTLYLGLRHPDIYGAIYAIGPGVSSTDRFDTVLDSWKGDSWVMRAYGQAFAPNPDGEDPYCFTPARDGSAADKPIMEQWLDGYANWDKKLDAYQALDTPLSGIGICYGTRDSYKWIPEGCEYLIDLMTERGITPTVYSFDGGHTIPPSGMRTLLVPFFREHLAF